MKNPPTLRNRNPENRNNPAQKQVRPGDVKSSGRTFVRDRA